MYKMFAFFWQSISRDVTCVILLFREVIYRLGGKPLSIEHEGHLHS